MADIDEVWN